MKKRILTALSAAVMLTAILPCTVSAEEGQDWMPQGYEAARQYAPISVCDDCIVLNGNGYADIVGEWMLTTDGSTTGCTEVYSATFYEIPKDPSIVGGTGVCELYVLKPDGDSTLCVNWEYVTHGQPSLDKAYSAVFEVKDGSITQLPDVTGDNRFSVMDVVALYKWLHNIGSPQNIVAADLNSDGVVDVFDLMLMKQLLLKN